MDDAASPTPAEAALVAEAHRALAAGAGTLDELVAHLRDGGFARAAGLDPAHLDEDLLGLLHESGEFWIDAAGELVVPLGARLATAWFTHLVTDDERATGQLALAPDLVALVHPSSGDTSFRLLRDGAVAEGVVLSIVHPDDEDALPEPQLRGPAGWLDAVAPGEAVALRVADGALELTSVPVRAGAGGREADLLRAAYDALAVDHGEAVWLYAVVLEALTVNDHAFRRPVRPIADLLDDARLGHGHGRVGPIGTDFDAVAERDDAASLVAGMFGLRGCCLEAFDDAVDALVAHAEGRPLTSPRELASALAHGDVAAALVQFAEAWRPDDGVVLAAALAGAFTGQHGRDRAGGALLLGCASEHIGEIPTARALFEEALLADTSLDVAIEHVARLVAIQGELDAAIRLRTRLAAIDDHDDDRGEGGFDPDLAFLRSLRPPRPTGVGRNDPCPCGSGRKFKACCMNKPPALSPEHHELWLDQKLASHASEPMQYPKVVLLAMVAHGDDATLDDFVDSGMPTTWLLHDDGLVREFAARYRDALPEIERPMLDARAAAPRTIVEVERVAGDTVTVRDLLADATHDLVDEDAVHTMRPGMVLSAHLAHSTTGTRFASVPFDVAPDAVDALRALLATSPDAMAIARWYRDARAAVSG